MSDSALSDSIHTMSHQHQLCKVALSTSHNLASLESVSLFEVGRSLEPEAVSSITQEVTMVTGPVDVSSDSLGNRLCTIFAANGRLQFKQEKHGNLFFNLVHSL